VEPGHSNWARGSEGRSCCLHESNDHFVLLWKYLLCHPERNSMNPDHKTKSVGAELYRVVPEASRNPPPPRTVNPLRQSIISLESNAPSASCTLTLYVSYGQRPSPNYTVLAVCRCVCVCVSQQNKYKFFLCNLSIS